MDERHAPGRHPDDAAAQDPRRSALARALAAFRPDDARESDYRERMLTLLAGTPDPFRRDLFDPGHFTASAFVLSPERDALLLVLHGKLKRWLQPGGHVDPQDPDLLQTARREVAEETGLTTLQPLPKLPTGGLLDVDVHAIPPLKGDPPHEHFDVRFALAARSRTARAGSDAHATRWVPLDQVSEVESDASVMRAVAKLQRLRALDPAWRS